MPDAAVRAEDLRAAALDFFFFAVLDLGADVPWSSPAADFFAADAADFFLAAELLAGTLFFLGAESESCTAKADSGANASQPASKTASSRAGAELGEGADLISQL